MISQNLKLPDSPQKQVSDLVKKMEEKYPEKEIHTYDGFDEYFGRGDYDAIIIK
jgi:hypothetical protein